MTDTLFNNGGSLYKWLTDFSAILRFGDFKFRFVNCQRIGMHRCLRYETVGKGKANNTANKACAAEKEEIPVEASGLFQRILTGLCCKR